MYDNVYHKLFLKLSSKEQIIYREISSLFYFVMQIHKRRKKTNNNLNTFSQVSDKNRNVITKGEEKKLFMHKSAITKKFNKVLIYLFNYLESHCIHFGVHLLQATTYRIYKIIRKLNNGRLLISESNYVKEFFRRGFILWENI